MRKLISRSATLSQLWSLASSSLYTNAFYLMLAQAAIAVLGFLFWVIVARFYTEAEVGYSSAIISTIGLVSLTGHIGLDSFMVRFLSRARNHVQLLNTCLTYSGAATLVISLVCAVGLGVWAPRIGFVGSQPVFLAAFVCFAVATNLSSSVGAAFVGCRKAKFLLVKDVIFGGVKLFLPLLFLAHFHAFGIVASWGIATMAALVISVHVLVPRVLEGYRPRPALTSRLVRRAWGFSGLSYVVSLVGSMPKYLMPVMVINVLGPEENAYFYVAWAMATVLAFIPGAVAQSLFAEAAYDKRTLQHNVMRAFQLSFALVLPAALLMLLLGDKFLLAFGESYSERSVALLQVLVFAGIPI
ncbi:MAG: lipopolysaccharide biosynthesis protein, partial [Chloroflexi bacterium]|nr:lipopolysaccharide biosynthesis protein [Chloroflexota bacterium]